VIEGKSTESAGRGKTGGWSVGGRNAHHRVLPPNEGQRYKKPTKDDDNRGTRGGGLWGIAG